ncbi:MAG: sigma-70 family RNA polymerase sigma factor [Ilumatobacteraceae bacterium]
MPDPHHDDERDGRARHDRRTDAAAAGVFERDVLPEIEVLLRVAHSLTRHHAEAEDLVQDTLLRAHRSIGTFDGRHPRAWLLTILRNTHINRNRRRRPELLRDPDVVEERSDSMAAPERTDDMVDRMLDHEIVVALDALDERFRQVVDLVDMGGLSYAEAAEVLDVPVGTVMSRLHRARARIRDHLGRTGVAPAANPPAETPPAETPPAETPPAETPPGGLS